MMVSEFQDILTLWLVPWATYIWIFVMALVVATLNAYFIFSAMRTADNRMHLMLKILHQNLKYFRSFDNRLNQISATSRKSFAAKDNSTLYQNAQLASISNQIKQIETMLASSSSLLPRQADARTRLLFPRVNRHQKSSNATKNITSIDRSQENYHLAAPDHSRPNLISNAQTQMTDQRKTANSLTKGNASKLMAIFDTPHGSNREKDQKVG